MNTPTRPTSAADILADAHARLLAAGIVMADAIVAAQDEGLACEPTLRAIHHELLAVADRQVEQLERLGPPKAPRLELIPGGITSSGMCSQCGRIGDHQPRCPELEASR